MIPRLDTISSMLNQSEAKNNKNNLSYYNKESLYDYINQHEKELEPMSFFKNMLKELPNFLETLSKNNIFETPVIESSDIESSDIETPFIDQPFVESSDIETPVIDPLVESLVVETPVVETPVIENPVESSDVDPLVESNVNRKIKSLLNDLFHKECKNKNITIEELTLILNKGVDINSFNENDDVTALHLAIIKKLPLSIITFLIDKGADINIVPKCNNTPFHTACKYGNVEVIKLMIDRGVHNMNLKNEIDETPLYRYLDSNSNNIDIDLVHLLIEKGSIIYPNIYNKLPDEIKNICVKRNDVYEKYTNPFIGNEIEYNNTFQFLWQEELQKCIVEKRQFERDLYVSVKIHKTIQEMKNEFHSIFPVKNFYDHFIESIKNICNYKIKYTLNSVILIVENK